MRDPVESQIIGATIWGAAAWIESHAEQPYEIFSERDDIGRYGYRITVERIDSPAGEQMPKPVAFF